MTRRVQTGVKVLIETAEAQTALDTLLVTCGEIGLADSTPVQVDFNSAIAWDRVNKTLEQEMVELVTKLE